jgi:pimeloyl-ACP methyl ester carboxylesterase
MESTITTLQALAASEITYHIRKYKETDEIKVSETELLKVLKEPKAQLLKEALWEGNYESYSYCDDTGSCWLAKTSTEEIIIAFRGTVPFVFDLSSHRTRTRGFEALKDGFMNIFLKLEEGENISTKYGEGSQVHEGFDKETDHMWDFFMATIQQLDPEGILPITITGHSQGGAIAFLAALRCCVEAKSSEDSYQQNIGQRIAQVITFGAPQPGSIGFALNYNKHYHFGEGASQTSTCLDDITYRYENAGDCIAIVPFKAADLAALFRHKYSFLPISMSFLENRVEKMKPLLEQYVPVGQLRYIQYRNQEIDSNRSYELRLADMYLSWAEKDKKGDIFSFHFLFTNDGYIKMYRDFKK